MKASTRSLARSLRLIVMIIDYVWCDPFGVIECRTCNQTKMTNDFEYREKKNVEEEEIDDELVKIAHDENWYFSLFINIINPLLNWSSNWFRLSIPNVTENENSGAHH